jgi:hypothetical protein
VLASRTALSEFVKRQERTETPVEGPKPALEKISFMTRAHCSAGHWVDVDAMISGALQVQVASSRSGSLSVLEL